MKLTKKLIIKLILTLIIIVLVLGGTYMYYQDINKNEKIELEEEILEVIEPVEEVVEETPKVYVDIKGAIKKPGVYQIENDKKVIDIVNLAGGLSDNADTSLINLAKKVSDEMVIIIYTKKQVEEAKKKETVSTTVNNTCVCPKISNDACLNNKNNDTSPEKKTDTTITNPTTTNEKININTATLEQLQTLTGIGESKAKAIIAHREENGNFEKIEDLKEVSGIGESVYEKIKDNITV